MPCAADVRTNSEAEAPSSALRQEARGLAANPADRAELTALRDELDELTPAWPTE